MANQTEESSPEMAKPSCIEISQWPFRLSQLFGFLPICIDKSDGILKLIDKERSWPLFSSIFCTLTICYVSGIGIFSHQEIDWIQMYAKHGKNTASVVYLSWVTSFAIATILTRLEILFRRKKYIAFWIDLLTMIDFLTNTLGKEELLKNNFSKLARKWRIGSFLFLIISFSILTSYMISLMLVRITAKSDQADTDRNWLDWALTLIWLLHFSLTFVLSYILQVLDLCLKYLLERSVINTTNVLKPMNNFFLKHGLVIVNSNVDTEEQVSADLLLSCYNRIESQIREFNKLFGFTVTVQIMYFIAQAVIAGYFLVWFSISSGQLNFNCVVASLPVAILWFLLYSDCLTSAEITETSKAFCQKLCDSKLDSDNLLKIIRLSNGSNPIVIRTNFFDFNPNLLASILGAVTTYLVVLVQFQGSDNS